MPSCAESGRPGIDRRASSCYCPGLSLEGRPCGIKPSGPSGLNTRTQRRRLWASITPRRAASVRPKPSRTPVSASDTNAYKYWSTKEKRANREYLQASSPLTDTTTPF